MADLASKLPLKRLESPIQKFTKVAVPTDLQRLQQHQHNIEKFQRLQQWDRLHQEHVNASDVTWCNYRREMRKWMPRR
uniref:STX17-like N-terminal domain-containing protein n=1 Tax=Denticeps clupeoides TaxID=299321 RepID=A0AAY4DUJ1_9TELE